MYKQIFKRDGHALCGLGAFDASGDPSRFDGDRMHWHVTNQFINKRLPTLAAFFGIGALNAMDEFHNGHHGKSDLDFPVARSELFQDLPDRVALPLAGNDHIGIED
jgi:hypothetical protein